VKPKIELLVNDKVYSGWLEASVTRSLDAIAGSFSLSATDRWAVDSKRWEIFPGDKCQLRIDSVAIVTGWVDRASPSYDADSHSISISGRDATGDLVDCSAVVKSNELRGLKLEQIVSELTNPFGLSVKSEVDTGEPFARFGIQPSETVFEAINRAAQQRFMVVTTDGEGSIIIANIGEKRATDSLIEGKNIKSAQAEYDFTRRFSEYKVIAQTHAVNDGWEDAVTSVTMTATDENVKRYRPKIIAGETSATLGSAQNRAELEAAQRAGKSTRVSVVVQGWKQSDGKLWEMNSMVPVLSPYLSQDGELLIARVQFGISDSSGMTTELGLSRPDAYLLGQLKGRKKKKGIGPDPWWCMR